MTNHADFWLRARLVKCIYLLLTTYLPTTIILDVFFFVDFCFSHFIVYPLNFYIQEIVSSFLNLQQCTRILLTMNGGDRSRPRQHLLSAPTTM